MSEIFICRDAVAGRHAFVNYKCLIKILSAFQQKVYANHVMSFHINNAQCARSKVCTYALPTAYQVSLFVRIFACKHNFYAKRNRWRAQIIKWFERFATDPHNKLLLSVLMLFGRIMEHLIKNIVFVYIEYCLFFVTRRIWCWRIFFLFSCISWWWKLTNKKYVRQV